MARLFLSFMSVLVIITGCSKDDEYQGVTFSYTISGDPGTGWHIIQLLAEHIDNTHKTLSARITPEGGSNMFSLLAGGQELIDAPDDLNELYKRRRGNPILYPTPNRVRNSVYTFMGDSLKMSFPGETRSHYLHGLVWDDAWEFDEPEIRPDAVVFKTWYIFDENNPRFPAFPFRNTLRVEYSLMSDRMCISYEVENHDTKSLGFGFGLHPFWKVIGNRDETRIQVALPFHMEATKDLLPTGKLEPVKDTKWSLLEPTPISKLRLDDVYFGATPETPVRVIYDAIGLEILQEATADFTHIVVYTPNTDFLCVENQTCSTDAHNLFSKGFKKESHLQIVKPGEKTGGSVNYILAWTK